MGYQRHLTLDRLERCPSCGTKESDWLDADGRVLHQPAYVVGEVECYGCKRTAQARQELSEREEHARIGRTVILRPSDETDFDPELRDLVYGVHPDPDEAP